MASQRDPRTGRFVSTANTPESSEGKFETYTDLTVEIQGGDPGQLAYDTVPRHGPDADDIAPGGTWPLYSRHPVLVSMDERAATQYGIQGGRLRDAARLSGISGAIGHVLGVDDTAGSPSGVQAVTDDGLDPESAPDVLRPASRGLGRGRER